MWSMVHVEIRITTNFHKNVSVTLRCTFGRLSWKVSEDAWNHNLAHLLTHNNINRLMGVKQQEYIYDGKGKRNIYPVKLKPVRVISLALRYKRNALRVVTWGKNVSQTWQATKTQTGRATTLSSRCLRSSHWLSISSRGTMKEERGHRSVWKKAPSDRNPRCSKKTPWHDTIIAEYSYCKQRILYYLYRLK